jgi:hypothetical protein
MLLLEHSFAQRVSQSLGVHGACRPFDLTLEWVIGAPSRLQAVRLLKGSCRDMEGRKWLGLTLGGTVFIHRKGASLSLICVNAQKPTKGDGKCRLSATLSNSDRL